MNATIVKLSSKGQITLPAKIRKEFKSSDLLVFTDKEGIRIKPLDLAQFTQNKNNISEDQAWLEASESSMDFWDNEADAAWDKV